MKEARESTSNAAVDANNHSFECVTNGTQAIVSARLHIIEAFFRERREDSRKMREVQVA